MITVVTVPIHTQSEANRSRHENPFAVAARVRKQRMAVGMCLRGCKALHSFALEGVVPASVHMVRVAPSRGLDPLVNLPSSLKAVQDAVCEFFGVDDGPQSPIKWSCGQERGNYAVRIEINHG